MTKTSLGVIAFVFVLWPQAAVAASPCESAQLDRATLRQCIDELQTEIQRLKKENGLISKQLCMIAIEEHRRNTGSEALKLIIESTCAKLNKQMKDGRS